MKKEKLRKYGLYVLIGSNILMLVCMTMIIYKFNALNKHESRQVLVTDLKNCKSIYIDNNVKLFGAVGDGVTDDSDAIQRVLDEKRTAYIPEGVYYLSKPLRVSGGMSIYGDNGSSPLANLTKGSQTVLKPKTVGITVNENKTSYQDSDFIIENIAFVGGTNCIDLPLFHMVKIRDCSFRDFSRCGVVIVRGEKIELHSLFFYNQNVISDKNISLGNLDDSTNVKSLRKLNFGTEGAWIDRISIQDITNQSGGSGNFNYGLYSSGILSNCYMSNVVCHGGIKRAISIDKLQTSDISTITLDACGSNDKPMDYCVYIQKLHNSTISNVQPAFAGNIRAKTQFYIGNGLGSTIINCYANGDNKDKFGFKVGNSVGQSITFIGCNGMLFSDANNEIIKRELTILGGGLTTNFSGANTNIYGQLPYSVNFMGDTNGSKEGSVDFQLSKSSGGGNPKIQFRVKDDYIQLGSIKIIVGEGDPNGLIEAPIGSMYIDEKGMEGKTLYVREGSKDSKRGWVSK